MESNIEKKLFEPLIIRNMDEIVKTNEAIIPELNLCIDLYKLTLNELYEYFIKNMNTKTKKILFIVNPGEDCLIKMTNEIAKYDLDPMANWFKFLQKQSDKNIETTQIQHPNGMYLSNYVCILDRKIKPEFYVGQDKKYKTRTVILDTFYGTGVEKLICEFVKKRFDGPNFKEIQQKNIVIDRIVCTYYYDYNADENEKYLYASFQLPFCNYDKGKGSYIYYLTMGADYSLQNECVLCSRFGQINYPDIFAE
jgi:hypothetical protein